MFAQPLRNGLEQGDGVIGLVLDERIARMLLVVDFPLLKTAQECVVMFDDVAKVSADRGVATNRDAPAVRLGVEGDEKGDALLDDSRVGLDCRVDG